MDKFLEFYSEFGEKVVNGVNCQMPYKALINSLHYIELDNSTTQKFRYEMMMITILMDQGIYSYIGNCG